MLSDLHYVFRWHDLKEEIPGLFEKAARTLQPLMTDQQEHGLIRWGVYETLNYTDDYRHLLPDVKYLVHDLDPMLRVEGIVRLHDRTRSRAGFSQEEISELVRLTDDSEPAVALAAAVELLQTQDGRAVPALIRFVGHEDSDVRRFVQYVLSRISGEMLGDDSARWRQWWQEQEAGTFLLNAEIDWLQEVSPIRTVITYADGEEGRVRHKFGDGPSASTRGF